MKTVINLISFPYFRKTSAIERLNEHIAQHSDLMPHQLAIATGCSLDDAIGILFLLFDRQFAEALLLVYHQNFPNVPMDIRKISDGPPLLPTINSLNDEVVEDKGELLFGFMFKLTNREFIFIYDQYQLANRRPS